MQRSIQDLENNKIAAELADYISKYFNYGLSGYGDTEALIYHLSKKMHNSIQPKLVEFCFRWIKNMGTCKYTSIDGRNGFAFRACAEIMDRCPDQINFKNTLYIDSRIDCQDREMVLNRIKMFKKDNEYIEEN